MNFCLPPENFRGGNVNPNVFKPGRNGNLYAWKFIRGFNPLASDASGLFNQAAMSAKTKRLITILVAGMALLGTTLYYLSVYFFHPVGRGPAGPLVARAAFSAPWTDRRFFWLASETV